MTKFKVGDRVRVVNYGGIPGAGGEGTIVERSGDLLIVDLGAPTLHFPKEFSSVACESTELESV